jgi:enoyl-CoA hydratase/carnithine racemase
MVDGLAVSNRGELAWLELDRPPRNLLAPDLMDGLRDALTVADAHPDVNAIVITGGGDVFCGGLDVAQIQAGADPVDFAAALVELYRVFPRLGKPVIAAVNGDALAGGYGLVCAADLAVAVDTARLGTFEVSVGLWPMIAQVPALHRLNPRQALENIITGEPFDAARALAIGAVNRVVQSDALTTEVERLAELCIRSGAAGRVGRRAFYRMADISYDDALTDSLEAFRQMFRPAAT